MDRIWIAAIVVLCALLAMLASGTGNALAQDETYVDLSIEITVDTSFAFTAKNHGTATAYGVTVDIEIADQTIHTSGDGFERKSGTTCSGNIPGTNCISGVWTVGSLEPGEETGLAITPRLASGLSCCPTGSDYWAVPARAGIKNTIPKEEERFKGDNAAVGWILVNTGGTGTQAAVARYWLEASVDDLLPDAGDTVKFSFKANSRGGLGGSVYGAKLRLKVDNGMGTPTATPPSKTTFAAATGLDRTWDWDLELVHPTTSSTLEVSTTLDDPLPAGVARSDLCLTAELTAKRPNNAELRPTSAEICLREDPVVLLEEGKATLFTIYPCVGVTAYPCTSSNNLEVLVTDQGAARAGGIGRDEAVLDPEKVFVQVKDPEARRVDSHSASVNSGTEPSWHTLRPAHANIGNSAVDGVDVSYSLKGFAGGQRENYTALSRTVTVAGLDGAAVPGAVNIRWPNPPSVEFAADPGGTASFNWFPEEDSDLVSLQTRFVEFSSLGTYKLDYTPSATHNNGTDMDATDDVVYPGTGSYIFHVGPVAELDVSDGAPNAALATGTRALHHRRRQQRPRRRSRRPSGGDRTERRRLCLPQRYWRHLQLRHRRLEHRRDA